MLVSAYSRSESLRDGNHPHKLARSRLSPLHEDDHSRDSDDDAVTRAKRQAADNYAREAGGTAGTHWEYAHLAWKVCKSGHNPGEAVQVAKE